MAGNNKPVGIAFSDPDLTELYLDGVEVTATAAQINSAGTTAPATAGTVEASKAVVVDANKRAGTFGALAFGEPNTYFTVTGISAAGTTQGTATALTGEWNNVTTCATDAGVKLPTAATGNSIRVRNSGVGTLRVWPFSGDAINALAADLSISIPPLGEQTFRAIDANTWKTCEMLVSNAPTTQKGSLVIKAADNTANYQVTIVNAEYGQASTVTLPDVDAAAGSILVSTGTTTVLTATTVELDKAAGVTAGTAAASKNAVLGATKNLDVLVVTNFDAGASASAGSVDVFPTTALKGKVAITKTDNTNDDTTSFVFGAHAAARTVTVPDPGAAANVLMTTGTATATTATTTEISKLTGIPASVTVVVTTPGASGTCDAAFTFKDAAGATCAFATALDFYLSGVDGLTFTAAITSILAADTPVGGVGVVTTGQQGKLVTTAGGLASVKLTGAAATTYYLTFLGPGGRLIISPALLTKA